MSAIIYFPDNPTREQIRKHNVNELQNILNQMNLPSSGKKSELVDRVYQFYKGLDSTEPTKTEIANACLSFCVDGIHDNMEIRSILEVYGPIQCFLAIPQENKYYVLYKTIECAQELKSSTEKGPIVDISYSSEIDLQRIIKDQQFFEKNINIQNTIHKLYHRTSSEPRIFWQPRKMMNEEEEE